MTYRAVAAAVGSNSKSKEEIEKDNKFCLNLNI